MNYQVELLIDAPFEKVATLYVDLNLMPIWEIGLKSIEHTEKHLFETNSKGIFHFEFGEHKMPMKVSVEKNDLPYQIIQIFEVPGAWNRCDNHFLDRGEQTLWQMDVTFKFENDMNVPLERFVEKTKASMTVFKTFAEKDQ